MKIEHIAMYVNDLEAARDFFVQYFGGRANDGYHNRTTDFRSYFISFDDGARLEIMKKPDMMDDRKALKRKNRIQDTRGGQEQQFLSSACKHAQERANPVS